MIGCQQHLSICRLHRRNQLTNTAINCFHRRDSRIQITGMTDHIRIRKIDHQQIMRFRLQAGDGFCQHPGGTHFRQLIIGGDIW